MELDPGVLLVIKIVDLIVCFILFRTLIAKRFNRWQSSDDVQFEGTPKDYINDRVFTEYCGLYFLTLLVFAYALSILAQVPDIRSLIETQVESTVQAGSWLHFTINVVLVVGAAALTPYLALILFVANRGPFREIDAQWRAYLLGSARVPRDAMNLKEAIKDALAELDLDSPKLKSVVDQLLERGLLRKQDLEQGPLDYCISPQYARQLLVQNLYLIDINGRFKNDHFPAADLERIRKELFTRAELISVIEENGQRAIQEQISALEVDQSRLAEMLAKNCLKAYPRHAQRTQVLQGLGLNTLSLGRKELNWTLPMCLVFFGIFLATMVSLLLFLPLFDFAGIPGPGKSAWFSLERLFGWTLGGSFSMLLAVGVGLVFNEALKGSLGDRSLLAYLVAFLTALTGSMIFFALSRSSFSLPYIAMSISFALLAFNAIASRGQRLLDKRQVLSRAIVLALIYAIASALLQMSVRVLFWSMRNEQLPGPGDLAQLDLAYFALFGFVRGFMVAFLVSYVFMDCERLAIIRRRRHARKQLDEDMLAEVSGQQIPCKVRDISQQGARLSVPPRSPARLGEEIALLFGFGAVKGQVVSADQGQVRVCFEDSQRAHRQLRAFIQRL